MKSIPVILALLIGMNANAATAWETHSSGDGTAFEERWVVTTAIASMSSNEKLASDLKLSASLYEHGGLVVWVTHAASALCRFSNWKLAVDKTVFPITPELNEDTKATVLHPLDDAESKRLLKLFQEGEKAAVRFHANCDNGFYLNYIGSATMTYSLEGSSAAIQFLEGAALRFPGDEDRQSGARNSDEMKSYQFAIAQKIARSWAMPASVTPDTECIVVVRQTPNGDVISADIVSCNGNDAVRRSVEAAVSRASPLPLPQNPKVFESELRITLRPDL